MLGTHKINYMLIDQRYTLRRNKAHSLLEFRELCEHAQCAWYIDLGYILYFYCFSQHFTSIPFYLVVYSIYTNACTVVNYLFASVTYRDNRNIIIFSHLDHANNLRLLIRFQHSHCEIWML